jgi:hypothetical protein
MRLNPLVFVYSGIVVGALGLIVCGEAHLIGLNPDVIDASSVLVYTLVTVLGLGITAAALTVVQRRNKQDRTRK